MTDETTMSMLTPAAAAFALVLALAGTARAQNLTLNVTPASFSFPSGDPDTLPVSTGPLLTVNYKISGAPHNSWYMTLRADGDLVSGGDAIAIGNVSWTATPAPFVNGVLSTVDQTLAQGSGNVTTTQHAHFTFALKNAWTYKPGHYTTTIVFTLVTP